MTIVRPTIAFLHTSPVHIATFDRLVAAHLPDAGTMHLVDESLLANARSEGLSDALGERVAARIDALASRAPTVIACTCSTIGEMTDAAAQRSTIPVLRGDRAMAEAAVRIAATGSGRIGVAVAVESTVAPTTSLLNAVADEHRTRIALTLIPCFDAWAAFEAGDQARYAHLIAESVREAVRNHAQGIDAIILAQPSMTGAGEYLADLPLPVLSSPEALMNAIATALSRST